MLKKIIISILLLIFFWGNTFGQFRPMENYPSPQVGSLGLYENSPVSLFTGQPNISIPLYEVNEGDLTLPITLNYNLSNVKPNRRSGWVGLGWNLSAGGYISRNVRGYYDEVKNTNGISGGFYNHYSKLQDVTSLSTLTVHKENFLAEDINVISNNNVYEMMSDEYSFNFGNYTGKFYLNEFGKWVVVSDDNIKVEFNPETGFRNLANLRPEIKTSNWNNRGENNRFFDIFTLITPDGVRYTFGGKDATEYSISYYNRDQSPLIPTTWFLTKIESTKGFQINLEYEADLPNCEIQFSAFSSYTYMDLPEASNNIFSSKFLNSGDVNYSINNTYGKNKLSGYLLFPVYLKNITTSFVKVNLHSALETVLEKESYATANIESLLYWVDLNDYALDPIKNLYYSRYAQFNAFLSGNPTLSANNILTHKLCWRVLRGISIIPQDENYSKTYYMEYGRSNRRKLTKIAERLGKYNPVTSTIPYNWYENGVEYFGQAIRLTTPIANGYSPKEYRFNYNEQKTFPRYIFSSTDHWGYYNGFTSPGMHREGERSLSEYLNFDQHYYSSKEPSYNIDISKAETLKEIAYPTGGKTIFEYRQNRYSKVVPENPTEVLLQKNGITGGVCISAIYNYDKDNILLQTKKYFYAAEIPTDPEYYITSGILQAEKKYVQNYYFSNGYMSLCSEGGFLTTSVNRNDSHINYSTVIEANYDANGNSNGYTRYRYTNYDTDIWGERHIDEKPVYSNVTGNSYYIPVSSRSVERGKLVSIEYFNSSNKTVKTIQYKYQKTDHLPLKTLYQDVVYIRYGSGYNDKSSCYVAHLAPTYTYRYLLQKEIETDFNTNGEILLSKEKNYTYNSQKLIKSILETNSNNKTKEQTIKYPFDYNFNYYWGNPHPVTNMVYRNMLNYPIEKKTFVNGKLTQYQFNAYSDDRENINNPDKYKWIQPYHTYALKTNLVTNDFNGVFSGDGNTAYTIDPRLSKEITYKYYPDGSIREVIDPNTGLITTYLWSYNHQYLIAKVENASYGMICGPLSTVWNNLQNDVLPTREQIEQVRTIQNYFLSTPMQITTYTYKPLVGMTSKTDPRGVATFYEYDDFNRLKCIKDNQGNVIQKFEYHYKE